MHLYLCANVFLFWLAALNGIVWMHLYFCCCQKNSFVLLIWFYFRFLRILAFKHLSPKRQNFKNWSQLFVLVPRVCIGQMRIEVNCWIGPPYESWTNRTNFLSSWENGEFFWGQTCCTLFHTQNEEKSQKISTRIRIHTRVYANTWWWGQICPPPE